MRSSSKHQHHLQHPLTSLQAPSSPRTNDQSKPFTHHPLPLLLLLDPFEIPPIHIPHRLLPLPDLRELSVSEPEIERVCSVLEVREWSASRQGECETVRRSGRSRDGVRVSLIGRSGHDYIATERASRPPVPQSPDQQ